MLVILELCKKIDFGHFWCKMGFGVWLTSVYGRVGLSDPGSLSLWDDYAQVLYAFEAWHSCAFHHIFKVLIN